MKIFKKISLLIVFFLTFSLGFGDSVSLSGEQLVVVENQDERRSPSEDLAPEFDDQEDGSFIDNYVSCNCISITKERIYTEVFPFYTSYNFTFWQPPQNF
ncbi:hypothetical protein [Aquipluma nitroreducens]|uniref:hypothetical protein n=1 Tax=Aquipluma nitroreducens TaxID=2010828 RepID=UPI00296FF808|nr:hypothetical protein [Aquipluma nitroreducens]